MYIKRFAACLEIRAGDGTLLRELLHPERDPVDIRCSLAVARVEPGTRLLPHRLKQAEVYYLLTGEAVMHINEEASAVRAGDAVYIPPGSVQWLENGGPEEVTFVCAVDPAWSAEGEEVL